MYNYKLIYKVVIWVFLGIGLWKEKEALNNWLRHGFNNVNLKLSITV